VKRGSGVGPFPRARYDGHDVAEFARELVVVTRSGVSVGSLVARLRATHPHWFAS